MTRARVLAAATFAVAFATGSAQAATWVFADFDHDGNLELTTREFRPLSRHIYRAWDGNRDARLESREFYRNLHNWWDKNGDGRLDKQEYESAWSTWKRGFQPPSFTQTDSNGDRFISSEEFRAGLANSGYFDVWDSDGDGILRRSEFETGLLEVWDTDGNGRIGRQEFAAWREPMARVASRLGGTTQTEPGLDPADTPAESTSRAAKSNRMEPDSSVTDTRAEPARRAALPGVRFVPLNRIDEQNVYNLRGESLGEVERVFRGPRGQYYAVVAFGEFLGLGGTHRIVPLSRMYLYNDRMMLPGVTMSEVSTFPLWRSEFTYRPLDVTILVPMRYASSTNRIEPGYDPVDTPAEPNRRSNQDR